MKNKRTYKNRRKKTHKKTHKRKNEKRLKMKGGVFIADDSLSIMQSIEKMINTRGADLEVISYSSLSGFILKLDVPRNPKNTNLYHFNEKPVYSIIFKLALISETLSYNFYTNIHGNKYRKKTEKKQDYTKEYEIQNKIYLDTLNLNRINICPSLIDLSFLDGYSANTFINSLNAIIDDDDDMNEAVNIFNFLKDQLNDADNKMKLGVITMEFVNYREYVLLNDRQLNDETYEKNCLYALAEIIVVFMIFKIINYDWHNGNIFGSIDLQKQPLLIDFGNSIDLINDKYDDVINTYDYLFHNQDPFELNTLASNNPVNHENDEDVPTLVEGENNDTSIPHYTNHDNYNKDFDEIKNISFLDFHDINESNREGLKTKLEKIIRFIAYMDYAKNCSKTQVILKYPQFIPLLRVLYGMDMWYDYKFTQDVVPAERDAHIHQYYKLNNFNEPQFNILKFDWKMDERKFDFICSKIQKITKRENEPILNEKIKEISEYNHRNLASPYPTKNEKPQNSPLYPIPMASLNTLESEKRIQKRKTIKRSMDDLDITENEKRIQKRKTIKRSMDDFYLPPNIQLKRSRSVDDLNNIK
jgi:hypothetical protein